MEARNPGFLNFFFIHEHLQRYTTSNEHGWGPWFFIPIVIGGVWPWIFFVPLGWSAMRGADIGSESRPASSDRCSAANFLAAWFVIIFVFFSIPYSKLGSYILPALPPLAIIAGYGLARTTAADAARRRPLLTVVEIANRVLAAGLFVFLGFAPPSINPALRLDALLLGTVLAIGAVAMYSLSRTASRIPYAVGALAIAMLATVPLAARVREDASPISTYRSLANAVQPYLADDCTLASYRHYVQSLPFYTRHREARVEYWGELSEVSTPTAGKSAFLIGSEARLRQAWSSGSCMVLIANARDLKALEDSLKPAPVVVGCEGKKFALYNGSLAPPPDAEGCLKTEPLDK